MHILALATSLMLSQTPTPAPEPSADRATAAAERAAAAAERSAAAAERAAAALEQLQKGVPGEGAPAAAAPAAAAPTVSSWSGTAGVALIALSGNASSLTFSANGQVEKKWERWSVGVKAFGTYGQAQAEGDLEAKVIALAAGVQARGERKLLGPAFFALSAGGETNHVKSVEFMGFVDPGLSVTWLDRKVDGYQKETLKTDLSMRFARELRYQYFPTPADVEDVDLIGPRVGLSFQYALNKDIVFFETAELVASIIGQSRFLLSSTTKLSSRLTEALSLSVSFALVRDSLPAPGKVPLDTALTVGLDYTL